MPREINSMTDLIKDLSETYTQLRQKKITIDEAKEIVNLSGKLIKAAGTQLKYNEFLDDKSEIEFFKQPKNQ